MKKRLLSTMLALCLVLTMLPLNALATDEPSVETETGAELQEEEATTPENPTPLTPIEVTEDEQTTTPDSGGTSELGNPSEDATNSQLSGSDSGNKQDEPMILSGNEEPARASVTDSEIMASGTCGEGVHSDDVTWTLTIYGVLTISGTGNMSHYEIGDYLNGSPSTIHDPPWYPSRGRIKSVIIENGITSIGNDSFQDCENLTKVTIPDSVTTIGWSAFKNCKKLNNITLPNNLLNISQDTFSGCTSLSNIILPEKVQHIEAMAFYGCKNLTSVTIKNIYTYSIVGSAFYGCNKLTDIYYAGSEDDWKTWVELSGYDFLKNVKIHYGSAGTSSGGNSPATPGENKPSTTKSYRVYYDNGRYESFTTSLEDCMYSATNYNPRLAHMLIAICNAIHNKSDMEATFTSLGFNSKNTMTDYSMSDVSLAYGFGIKKLNDGKALVLIVGRGTVDFEEIIGDLEAKANSSGEHTDFSETANRLHIQLTKFLNTTGKNLMHNLDTKNFSNIKFVITGHSRGGAVANILAKNLSDLRNGADENIFAYTFACPDVAVITPAKAIRYPTIFNIGNAKDVVTWVPRAVWFKSGESDGWGKDSYWDKYGKSYWYCDIWKNKISLDLVHFLDYHIQGQYLLDLHEEYGIYSSYYRNRTNTMDVTDLSFLNWIGFKLEMFTKFSFLCPVDIEIYTADNQLAGEVINNKINIFMPNKMYAYVADDKKYVYVSDDNYTIKLNGTADGTMEYSVQSVDLNTGEILEEKVFRDVALFNGKQMLSFVDVNNIDGTNTSIVPLYVLDENGNSIKEVLPDGNGTEVYISRTVTFNANGGTVNPATMTTETNGKLSSLPTPTRSGYRFKGWYTATNGGTQITLDTIFVNDATVYARWANSSGGSGNSTISSGNSAIGNEGSILNDVNSSKKTNLENKSPNTGDQNFIIWLYLIMGLAAYATMRICAKLKKRNN